MRIRVPAQKGSLAVDVFLFGRFSRVEGGVRLGGITRVTPPRAAQSSLFQSGHFQSGQLSLVTSYAQSC